MRDPLHWLSVRYKLALLFVGVCLVAFGIGGVLVARSARGALESEILTRLEVQCGAYATALDSQLTLLAGRTEDFASDGHIRGLTHSILNAESDSARDRARAELERHLRVNKLPLVDAFLELVVLGPGDVPVRGGEAPPGINRVAAFGDLDVRGDDAPTMWIVTPLTGLRNAEPLGKLAVRIDVGRWIRGALANSRVDDEASKDVRLQLFDRSKRGVVVPELGQGLRLIEAEASAGDGVSFSHVRGVYGQHFPLLTNGWSLRIELNAREQLDAVSALQSRLLALAVVLAAAASLLLYFPLRFLARPLAELKTAAQRIEGGDLATRVEVRSSDEIGELAGSFNSMAAALEQRAIDLRTKQAELRSEHGRLQAVVAAMGEGLIVVDHNGEVLIANRAAQQFLDRVQVRSSEPHNLCRLRDGSPEGGCAACLFEPSKAASSCVIDVGAAVYEVHSTPFALDAGRGRMLLVREITQRVERDEAQIHQERLAVLGEVSSVMAHELNNPLTAISMFNQMMQSEIEEGSPLRDNVDVIQRNVDACKSKIRELLDYSTGASPELAEIDVHSILEDVAQFLDPISRRAGVNLAWELEATESEIAGDEVQIRQVFVNLIMNAIQAIGGGGGSIEIRTQSRDGTLEIEIADDGPGVPEAMVDEIFRPFFTTKERGSGTGLGLPTARRICELHGGGIDLVESTPGRTVFLVRLRLAVEARATRGTA